MSFQTSLRRFGLFAMAAASLSFLMVWATCPSQAQTMHVLHTFTGSDGATPYDGVTLDAAGNLYGATGYGGANGYGSAFKLTQHGSGWIFSPLYNFTSSDTGFIFANLAIGPGGALYGTKNPSTLGNGGQIFNLKPQQHPCHTALCPWTEKQIYQFSGGTDGNYPGGVQLVFDAAGNGYGTTTQGGTNNAGVVYRISHSSDGWTQTVLYDLDVFTTGANPLGGITIDGDGNLYTTSSSAGGGTGTVFQLTQTGSGWVANVLHIFPRVGDDGHAPSGGVVLDPQGNLYGMTGTGGPNGGGAVYEVSPAGGSWTEKVLYSFSSCYAQKGGLARDAAGNLYGVNQDCSGISHVFKLSPSGDQWVYTDMHAFSIFREGEGANSLLAVDSNGNIYGMSQNGGTASGHLCDPGGCGTVWEITPN